MQNTNRQHKTCVGPKNKTGVKQVDECWGLGTCKRGRDWSDSVARQTDDNDNESETCGEKQKEEDEEHDENNAADEEDNHEGLGW